MTLSGCIRSVRRTGTQPTTFRPGTDLTPIEETVTPIDDADRSARRLRAEQRIAAGIRVVSLHGEIDHNAKDLLRESLGPLDARPAHIVADLGRVTFLDSSGITVLIAAHQQIVDAGGWLRIAAAEDMVREVLHLVTVDAVIACYPTVEQALSG
ncbi:STAS domain-containing protein [Streptomyces galbus]|uniref:Anti-sigma factor antagonist n=1 Tax=Streptomyces galbus TaxID=33898 RepID=A0ABX1IMD7_STRGB|nr:STAS domain-containing protein [Streptomyces galbus]